MKTLELTLTDKSGEQFTVAKHANGSHSCSCRTWRINNALQVTKDCTHVYKAKRKGL